MAKPGSLEDIWRRSLDLNLKYYGAMGRLASDYVKDLTSALSEVRAAATTGESPSFSAAAAPSTSAAPATNASSSKQAGAIVLEGEAGSRALGVFLIENHLNHDISAKTSASSFVAASGREVRPTVVFDPESTILGPGEQSLVRVVAIIDESLDPEVRYTGEITIPELVGTRIPVVLRRRLGENQIPIESTAPAANAATRNPKRRKARTTKRASAAKGKKAR